MTSESKGHLVPEPATSILLLLDIQLCFKVVFTCQKVVRLAEKVKKGEKVRNICQKVVQLAGKGEKR